eukprot:7380154-Prymnesium_polylepis.2
MHMHMPHASCHMPHATCHMPHATCAYVSPRARAAVPQPSHRAWAWTFWEAEVPVRPGQPIEQLVCKATDAAHNVQPERADSIWNLRGLANNSWHRVPITTADAPPPDAGDGRAAAAA